MSFGLGAAVLVCRRIEVKESIAWDLVAGRTTLADATARFMLLNEPYPYYLQMIRDTYPGSTDQERTARNVMDYTLGRVTDRRERERLAGRFEGELRTMIGSPAPATQ